MNHKTLLTLLACSVLVAGAIACGSNAPQVTEPVEEPSPVDLAETTEPTQPAKQPPPASGTPRDIAFPPIARGEAAGLEINTVEWHQLPIVYLRLVIKSGSADDPAERAGMADLVASMLKEGTRTKSSQRLAEEVEFLGADIWTSAGSDTITIGFRAMADHLDEAMAIVADVARNPAFRADELDKLRRREKDRLSLMTKRPNYLVQRQFMDTVYGDHPYARIDTTVEVLDAVRRADLVRWHRAHFVPNNAYMVVAGDVTGEAVQAAANRAFRGWRSRDVAETERAAPPLRTERQVYVVNRPGSEQSVIHIGEIGVERSDEDWIPLMVANQVLGGSAASRLFMDLREQRSLTYGAYSRFSERLGLGTFRATASVRTDVTVEAVGAFFEHFERIVAEAPPQDELVNAQRYLSDSFPLRIDTPGKIASLASDLRIFGLEDNYYDSFRTRIREVTPEQALAAAREHIHPDKMAIVVVGQAADFAGGLARFGAVTVLNEAGEVEAELPAGEQPSTETATPAE